MERPAGQVQGHWALLRSPSQSSFSALLSRTSSVLTSQEAQKHLWQPMTTLPASGDKSTVSCRPAALVSNTSYSWKDDLVDGIQHEGAETLCHLPASAPRLTPLSPAFA